MILLQTDPPAIRHAIVGAQAKLNSSHRGRRQARLD